MMDVHVLIVDDHPIFRQGLRALLVQERWVGAIDEAATVAEAVRTVTQRPVDLVSLDVHLPDGRGTDHVGRLLRIRRGLRVLMLTGDAGEATVAAAVGEGAHGYLLKDDDPDDVVAALRTVAAGGFVLGPRVPHTLAAQRGPAPLAPPLDKITPRERDLLVYLTAGRGNAEIAQRLGLAEKTVRNQMSFLFDKIGVNDRTNAAILARRSGLAPSARATTRSTLTPPAQPTTRHDLTPSTQATGRDGGASPTLATARNDLAPPIRAIAHDGSASSTVQPHDMH